MKAVALLVILALAQVVHAEEFYFHLAATTGIQESVLDMNGKETVI